MTNQEFNQLWVQLLWKNFSYVKNATNTLTRWQKMKNKQRKRIYSEICKYFVHHTVCGLFSRQFFLHFLFLYSVLSKYSKISKIYKCFGFHKNLYLNSKWWLLFSHDEYTRHTQLTILIIRKPVRAFALKDLASIDFHLFRPNK